MKRTLALAAIRPGLTFEVVEQEARKQNVRHVTIEGIDDLGVRLRVTFNRNEWVRAQDIARAAFEEEHDAVQG